MATIHTEKAEIAWWVLLLFRILALGMLLLFAWAAANGMPGWQGLLVASFLTTWGLLAFQEMRYELTEQEVIAWLWPFRTTMAFAEIERVELREKLPWWVGIGCHWWKGTWWYVGRTGSYVHVLKKDGRGLAMTPKEPERLAGLIEERAKQAQKAKKAR